MCYTLTTVVVTPLYAFVKTHRTTLKEVTLKVVTYMKIIP